MGTDGEQAVTLIDLAEDNYAGEFGVRIAGYGRMEDEYACFACSVRILARGSVVGGHTHRPIAVRRGGHIFVALLYQHDGLGRSRFYEQVVE